MCRSGSKPSGNIIGFSVIRIRIRHVTLMRIRIQVSKMMQIHADPDSQHCRTVPVLVACPKNTMMLGLKSNKIYVQNIMKLNTKYAKLSVILYRGSQTYLFRIEKKKKTGILQSLRSELESAFSKK